MFVVQDVFRAAAALRSRLEARRAAGRGPDLVGLHDALLPVGLGTAGDARPGAAHGRLAADRLGRHRHARAARAGRAPWPRRRRAACARVALTAAGERTFEELFPRFNAEESLACAGLGAERARAARGAPAHARDNDSERGREMAVDVTAAPTGARTGAQFLAGLRDDGREVWMGGERIDDVVGHPLLGGARARPRGLVRLVPRARRDVPVRVADDRPARQRLLPAAALARGSRAPPRRHAPAWRSTTAA